MHPAVRSLYKELLHAAREYPGGMEAARRKLKGAFLKNATVDVKDREVLEESLKKGEHVLRELDALRRLHKYRYGASEPFVSLLICFFVSLRRTVNTIFRFVRRSSSSFGNEGVVAVADLLLWPVSEFFCGHLLTVSLYVDNWTFAESLGH